MSKRKQSNEDIETLQWIFSCMSLHINISEGQISGSGITELMSIFNLDNDDQNTYYGSHSHLGSYYARKPGFLYPQW